MNQRVGIFYSTSGGRTRKVVERMKGRFEPEADIFDIAETQPAILLDYELLILGTPTYGQGELHYRWNDFLDRCQELALAGRRVALFALGDQRFHGKTFAGALAHLDLRVRGWGAHVLGLWPIDGYKYEASPAAGADGFFPGLVIDEVNQRHLTDERIARWVAILRDGTAVTDVWPTRPSYPT